MPEDERSDDVEIPLGTESVRGPLAALIDDLLPQKVEAVKAFDDKRR